MSELQIKFSPEKLKQEKMGIGDLRQSLNEQFMNVLQSPTGVTGVTLGRDGLLTVHGATVEKGLVLVRGKVVCALGKMREVARSLGGTVQS